MTEVHVSVRNLVEFILRSGDIDNRKGRARDNAMQEGGRIHRMIQRRMGSSYHAEVALRYTADMEEYSIVVEGRADGIIIEETGEVSAVPELSTVEIEPAYTDRVTVTVDEIKGTYREIHKIREAVPVHLAQAKCYAAIYGIQNRLRRIRVRMTYCNMETEELKYFHFEYDVRELQNWFLDLIQEYKKWADFQFQWEKTRTASIKELEFPFPYREGQKDLVTYVYRTIYHKRKLFVEAPTGVGKTISTLFPAVKAMGEGMGDKIFYLTAKTITRTVAENTIVLMREKGLKLKFVVLTARDKICFMEESQCNPDFCPYARGHFDRVNEALYDMLTHTDNYSRGEIESYARKHQVCPFEFCLDMSLFADVVIGDYNYLFDPHVYLKRFFAEGVQENYIFLIDEAHNLVERGREMYSAALIKEDFLAMKRLCKEYSTRICHQLDRCNKELLALKRNCVGYRYEDESSIAAFVRALNSLSSAIDDYLDDHEESPVKAELTEFYFGVSHFLMIHEDLDEHYEIYTKLDEEGNFRIRLFCVNPGRKLAECMQRGRSSILFSATLLPIQYYKKLLGAEEKDYEVYARSIFEPEKRGLFIASDVTSRYKRRSEEEYYKIAFYIHRIITGKRGNYMAFFPSYAFMNQVLDQYEQHFATEDGAECLKQEEYMNEESREGFLTRFEEEKESGHAHTLIGFCVLGGIFSEGIDLKNDSLIGAVIVGTGLPLVCSEREILKNYFEKQGDDGFDYAYRYPGMNKVLQAAGRVIRTAEDIGIVALLDDRFLTETYLRMFPREWKTFERVSLQQIEKKISDFWEEKGWSSTEMQENKK